MNRKTTLPALGAAVALLTGCAAIHDAQQSFSSSFHQGFRTSFRSSFMRSCTQRGATQALCGCVEQRLERSSTDDQLVKMSMASAEGKKAVTDAVNACAQRRE